MSKETVTVYWSPALFSKEKESWNLLYREPELLKSKLHESRSDYKNGMLICPSIRDYLNNMYVLKSNVDDHIDLPIQYLTDTHMNDNVEIVPSNSKQIVSLRRQRPSSLIGYSNLVYNLAWLFFASEPLVMRFTAPFLPAKSPSEGAILASGELDIGSWFRVLNLDYHIPLTSDRFVINAGDELAYLKFETTKRVELKRFILNQSLMNFSDEMGDASSRYGRFKPLTERYEMSKKSKMSSLVLSEIQKNVVEE